MTYPRQLTKAQESTIQPILDRLSKVPAGERFYIYDSPAACSALRYLLYAWLHNNNLKRYFKIENIRSGVMAIKKNAMPQPKISSQGVDTRVDNFVLDYLLDITNENEAIAQVREHSIDDELAVKVIDEWRRLQAL